jgi:ArsR family transcriptional regulator
MRATIGIVAIPTTSLRMRGTARAQELELDGARVEGLVELLKAAGDPTRLQILAILAGSRSPVCICDLTATFDLSQPTISHHIGKLRRTGLVSVTRRGIWAYYELRQEARATVRSILQLT